MNKTELQELTRLGVRQKLEQVERYLARIHQDFPEMFTTPTPPVFVRPDEKHTGNSWPAFVATVQRPSNGTGTSSTAPAYAQIRTYLQTQPHHRARVVEMARALARPKSGIASALAFHTELFRRVGYGTYQLITGAQERTAPARKPMSAATRKKLSLAMKRRHASGDLAVKKAPGS